MKNLFTLLIVILFTWGTLKAQPAIQWQASLGGTAADLVDPGNVVVNNMTATNDGGCVIAGTSYSNDGDVTGHHGLSGTSDYWIVKLDSTGSLEWQRSLGGSFDDYPGGIAQTSDGGYIIVGTSFSSDGDITAHHDTANGDAWVVKLDHNGNMEWERSLGGTDDEAGAQVIQDSDGGYIVAADTRSTDGDVSVNKGISDIWIVKLDSLGNIVWDKSLGGSSAERCYMLRSIPGNGYMVTGITTSNDSDITFNGHPGFFPELWVVKTDSLANIEWDKCFGGSSLEWGFDSRPTADGGYILSATTISSDGDVVGNHGGMDIWIIKVDASGNLQWSRCYGGTGNDQAKCVRQTPDMGYLISGSTTSTDGDVSFNIGDEDCWLIKTDSLGAIEWEKTYGGTGTDAAPSIDLATDGSFVISGESTSNDVDVSGHHGATTDNDIWAVKLTTFTTGIKSIRENDNALFVSPNPVSGSSVISFDLQKNDLVSIDLFDNQGRKVRTVSSGLFPEGSNQVAWNPRVSCPEVKSGTYILQMKTTSQTISRKVFIVR